MPNDTRLIIGAGARFRRRLREDAGGRLPRSERGWQRLALAHDVHAGPMIACPPGFRARLWYVEDNDLWLIGYNPRAPLRQRCRFIAHELAEYLAVNDYPSLFDDLPGVYDADGNAGRVYRYDGGNSPEDMRHRIAQRVEHICFRRV